MADGRLASREAADAAIRDAHSILQSATAECETAGAPKTSAAVLAARERAEHAQAALAEVEANLERLKVCRPP
jgi:hypothetical protein